MIAKATAKANKSINPKTVRMILAVLERESVQTANSRIKAMMAKRIAPTMMKDIQ